MKKRKKQIINKRVTDELLLEYSYQEILPLENLSLRYSPNKILLLDNSTSDFVLKIQVIIQKLLAY